jgi:hypothetical protein
MARWILPSTLNTLREEANPMMSHSATRLHALRADRVLPSCFRKANGLAAAALALALATPSLCSAQTLSLGNAGGFGLFGAYNAGAAANIGGVLNVSGGVGLDANSSLMLGTGSAIQGAFDQSSTAQYWGPTPGGGVTTGSAINTLLAQGSASAFSAASTAASWSGNTSFNSQNDSVTLTQQENVVTVNSSTNSGLLTLPSAYSNNTTYLYINGNGTSNQQVVFNITGNLWWNNVDVVLNNISASNVFFNFVSGDVNIVGGTISGSILDMMNGTSNGNQGTNTTNMSLDGVVINGSVVTDGFVDMGNAVITPEMPTGLMAGLASLLVAASAGVSRLRRRRTTPPSALPNAWHDARSVVSADRDSFSLFQASRGRLRTPSRGIAYLSENISDRLTAMSSRAGLPCGNDRQ